MVRRLAPRRCGASSLTARPATGRRRATQRTVSRSCAGPRTSTVARSPERVITSNSTARQRGGDQPAATRSLAPSSRRPAACAGAIGVGREPRARRRAEQRADRVAIARLRRLGERAHRALGRARAAARGDERGTTATHHDAALLTRRGRAPRAPSPWCRAPARAPSARRRRAPGGSARGAPSTRRPSRGSAPACLIMFSASARLESTQPQAAVRQPSC